MGYTEAAVSANTDVAANTAARHNEVTFATGSSGRLTKIAQELDLDLSDLDGVVSLSGVAAGDTNLGTFTGDTITDNVTNKAALQELETAVELKANALLIGPEENADFTAVKGTLHPVNTLPGPVVATPPASPVAGDRFALSDSRANASSNTVTVDFTAAGQNFHGGLNNSILSVSSDYVQYLYIDATIGWITER